MHEFGIAQGLMDVVLGRAREAGATRIEQVNLAIGVLAGVEEEALQFAFRALGEDTPAAETRMGGDSPRARCKKSRCAAIAVRATPCLNANHSPTAVRPAARPAPRCGRARN